MAEIIRKPMQQLGLELPDEGVLVLRSSIDVVPSEHGPVAVRPLVNRPPGRRITTVALEQLAATPEFHEYYRDRLERRDVNREIDQPAMEESRFDEESSGRSRGCQPPLDPRQIRQSLDVLQLFSSSSVMEATIGSACPNTRESCARAASRPRSSSSCRRRS